MEMNTLDFETCIAEAKSFHGDLCAGIVLGTRMAILGLNAIGIDDPKGADRKNLIVYVETDRCASDAILAVTGCHPGQAHHEDPRSRQDGGDLYQSEDRQGSPGCREKQGRGQGPDERGYREVASYGGICHDPSRRPL